jgi:cysteine desulfurase
MQAIYLDYNATTPIRPEVLDAMLPCLQTHFGNPSSLHQVGRRAKQALEEAREQVAGLIHAKPAEVLFTSGGTESNNLALRGIAEGMLQTRHPKNAHIITTGIEHSSVLETTKVLGRQEVTITTLPVDAEGRLSPSDLEAALTPDTTLISIALANHEIGTLQPIRELSHITHTHGVPLHVDAVQAAGKLALDVDQLGVDALSLSAHKIYGPKGIGALYMRTGTALHPVFRGGPQEREKRPGTENVAAAVGFGTAASLAGQDIEAQAARLIHLIALLWHGIQRHIPDVVRHTPMHACLPNTLNVGFSGASGEGLMMGLDLADIAVSTGSACAAGSVEPSHVLQALGCDEAGAKSAIRFSAGMHTTEEEIAQVLEVLPQIVERVRRAAK